MGTITTGLRMLWIAYRDCDDENHIECRDNRHQVRPEDEQWSSPSPYGGIRIRSGPKQCLECGSEIIARPNRNTMLRLAKQALKSAVVPRWVTVHRPSGPKRRVLMWRRHELRLPVRGSNDE